MAIDFKIWTNICPGVQTWRKNCQALQSNEQRIVQVWKTKTCPGCKKERIAEGWKTKHCPECEKQRIVQGVKNKELSGCKKQRMKKYPDGERPVFRLPAKDGQMAHQWFDNKHLHHTIIVEAMVDPSTAVSRHQET